MKLNLLPQKNFLNKFHQFFSVLFQFKVLNHSQKHPSESKYIWIGQFIFIIRIFRQSLKEEPHLFLNEQFEFAVKNTYSHLKFQSYPRSYSKAWGKFFRSAFFPQQ